MLFYLLQIVLSVFIKKTVPSYDLLIAVFVIFLIYAIHISKGLSIVVPIFIGIGFIPHILGLYPIFPIYENAGLGTLYGAPQLMYHYDWIVHFFAMFCYTIAFASLIFKPLKKCIKNTFIVFILILFLMQGFGAMNEVVEYIGFETWGYGEGFLEFGDGDSSPTSGPWQNSSMDMVCNFLGSFLGIVVFIFLKK